MPVSRDALLVAGALRSQWGPVPFLPRRGLAALKTTGNGRPVPRGWGLPRTRLGTVTLEARKGGGGGTGWDRGGVSLSPVATIKMRSWAQVEAACQGGSSAAGGSTRNAECRVLGVENLQPGPGRLWGGCWAAVGFFLSPPNTPNCCRQRHVVKWGLCRKVAVAIPLIPLHRWQRLRAVFGEGLLSPLCYPSLVAARLQPHAPQKPQAGEPRRSIPNEERRGFNHCGLMVRAWEFLAVRHPHPWPLTQSAALRC